MPKKRICPSLNCAIWLNMRRHPFGDKNGKMPSITSTMARASQMASAGTDYFLPLADAGAEPLKTLKNSEEAGSSTITSVFLEKLAL
jgi:hypothetical protein